MNLSLKWVLLMASIILRLSLVLGAQFWISSPNQRPQDLEDDQAYSDFPSQMKDKISISKLIEVLNGLSDMKSMEEGDIDSSQDASVNQAVLPQTRGKKAISLFSHWKPFRARPAPSSSTGSDSRASLQGRSSRPLGQPLRWGRR